MSCQSLQKFISSYLDGTLAGEERENITRHLAHCRECGARWEETRHVRFMLHDLAAAPVPLALASRLRALAVHERMRRLTWVSFGARVRNWVDYARLWADNLMRPLALPFAGGVLSALVLFSMLVPTLAFQFNFRNDVPTALYTQASLSEMAPFTFNYDTETMVEVTVNDRGEVANYSLPNGEVDRKLDSTIANILILSSFKPATLFGRPTYGKVWLSFRRSHIVVKG